MIRTALDPYGVAFVRDLRAAGATARDVARAVESGELLRLRSGLVADARASEEVRRAARVGGRLAGVSAAHHHGLWVPIAPLTVAVPEHAGRVWHPDVPGAQLGRAAVRLLRGEPEGPRFGISDVITALHEVCLTEEPRIAIAIADSALRRTELREFDLLELDSRLPPRASGIIARCDARAESGSESLVRTDLQDVGLNPIPQSRIPFTDAERVDLRIGDRLLIECDSAAHHGSPEQRMRDLRRDARLTALGFIVLHFDYRQIMFERESVIATVLRYVDLGLHFF